MRISEQGIALITRFEGFSPKPYLCPAGKPTIGYGHVIGAGERFSPYGISRKEAEALLFKDIEKAEGAVLKLVRMPLSQGQFDALVSFTYNVGQQAFGKSKLLRFINQGMPGAAAGEFSRWVYSQGRMLHGLAKRRDAESTLFLGIAT